MWGCPVRSAVVTDSQHFGFCLMCRGGAAELRPEARGFLCETLDVSASKDAGLTGFRAGSRAERVTCRSHILRE